MQDKSDCCGAARALIRCGIARGQMARSVCLFVGVFCSARTGPFDRADATRGCGMRFVGSTRPGWRKPLEEILRFGAQIAGGCRQMANRSDEFCKTFLCQWCQFEVISTEMKRPFIRYPCFHSGKLAAFFVTPLAFSGNLLVRCV